MDVTFARAPLIVKKCKRMNKMGLIEYTNPHVCGSALPKLRASILLTSST
jgi:hypothetical protein